MVIRAGFQWQRKMKGAGGDFEISLNELVIGDICFQQKVKVSQKKNKAHFHETRSFKSYLIRLKNNYIQGYSEIRCNS